jgi:hypothetical protein
MMMTKQKKNSKFTKAASLAASLALVLNGGVKFASAYDEQSISCEGKTASISCPTGELISIVDGWYGRTEAAHVTGEPVVCPHSATSNRNCPFHKTGQYDAQKAKIGGACEGKNSCSVKASNGYFGDPCGGTFKYLNISYNCVDPSAEEDAKAEESAADL